MDHYQRLRAEYRRSIPDTFNFGTDVVDAWASDKARDAAAPALICCNGDGRERRYGFSEIAALTDRLAAALQRRGIGKGDRVLVMLPRIPDWQIAMVAVLMLGPIDIHRVTMLTEKDLAYRLANSGARAVVTTTAEVAKFAGQTRGILRIAADPAIPAGDEGGAVVENWLPLAELLAEDPGA